MIRGLVGMLAGVAIALGGMSAGADEEALPGSAEGVRPVLVGTPAPAGVLKTGSGQAFDLGAAMAEKPTVLVFYRGSW